MESFILISISILTLSNDAYDVDVYAVVRIERGNTNVSVIEYVNGLIREDNQLPERIGGDMDTLGQNDDDSVDDSWNVEDFLDDEF